jgi:hypothetical protein
MAVIDGENVTYKSQKTIMLTFNLISEQKAKNQLMLVHAKILAKFMS